MSNPFCQFNPILHISLNTAQHPTRILKETASAIRTKLTEKAVIVAKWEHELPDTEELAPGVVIRRVRLTTRGLPKTLPYQMLKGIEWQHRIVRLARELKPAVVVAHSVRALPAGVAAKRATGALLVYDAHELETERNGLEGLGQRIDRCLERWLIPRCDAVVCVSDSIADWYEKTYRMPRPAVVRNIPDTRIQSAVGESRILRERFGIGDEEMLFIYQGGLFPGRRIEQLIRVFERTRPDRHVVFMGYGELEGVVRAAAERRRNIHFQPAVPPGEVLRHTASADVGLTGVENVCLSYYYSLPNKLFEYLAAGVPFLAPDYPEMRAMVERHRCGWVVGEEDEAWEASVNGLGRDELARRMAAARETAALYSWANEEKVFLEISRRMLKSTCLKTRKQADDYESESLARRAA